MLQAVKSIEGITPDRLTDEILGSSQPLILKGFCEQWPLVKLAEQGVEAIQEYILQFYKGMPVSAGYGEPEINGRIFYNDEVNGFNFKAARVNLNLVFDTILKHINDANPPTAYIGSTSVEHLLPGFRALHNAGLDKQQAIANIWLGNASTIAAHYDFPTNFACCLVGRRRFTLFPPEQLENLHVGPLEFAPGGQAISMVDFDKPDHQKYPKFKSALEAASVAELEPGDALLLPSMWWHHVKAFSKFNVLLTHWWLSTPYYYGQPIDALKHAILSVRNLPKEQRYAWQQAFNYYVFEEEQARFDCIPDNAKGLLKDHFNEDTAKRIRAELINKLNR